MGIKVFCECTTLKTSTEYYSTLTASILLTLAYLTAAFLGRCCVMYCNSYSTKYYSTLAYLTAAFLGALLLAFAARTAKRSSEGLSNILVVKSAAKHKQTDRQAQTDRQTQTRLYFD